MVYDNGIYREATEEEINEIKVQNQKILLEELMKDEVTNADLISIILYQYTITTPQGENKPVTEVVGTEIELPFKLGYKWELVLDSSAKAFAYQLVPDPDAIGTEKNPIIFADEIPLINGAFYVKEGKTQVFMSGQWVEW